MTLRLTLLAVLSTLGSAALADEYRPRLATLPLYQQECGSCHLAYPPGLLPAQSWRRLMGGLPRHFGVDASLDAAPQQTLLDWLAGHAGGDRKLRRDTTAPPEDRISRAGWFLREHREVPADAWQRSAIKSPSNCGACHTQAERGDFDEHGIRIPR